MVLLRLKPDLLDRIRAAIDSANERRAEEEYNLQAWILAAVNEKLAKLGRGRKKKDRQDEGQADGR